MKKSVFRLLCIVIAGSVAETRVLSLKGSAAADTAQSPAAKASARMRDSTAADAVLSPNEGPVSHAGRAGCSGGTAEPVVYQARGVLLPSSVRLQATGS